LKIAVVNSGSSSIKFKLFEMKNESVLASIIIEQIGDESSLATLTFDKKEIKTNSYIKDHHAGLELIFNLLSEYNILNDFSLLNGVGHRVVHGGEYFSKASIINDKIIQKIQKLIPLAPLHNPANLEGILALLKVAPYLKQVAVFDTAFHSTMPQEAFMYALPFEMYEKHKIRRYGFHGTSHSFVMKETAKELNIAINKLNIITVHLGNGASLCAIKNGKSIDTSMGFTPLEGLIMGTRCGDIDPAIAIYLQRELGLSFDEVDEVLNKKSGLLGICSKNDVRNILENSDEKSKLAIQMMIRKIQKYIGSYMALLPSIDAIVFTGGIGENSKYIRDKIMSSSLFVNTKMLVIKTNEELEIARECLK
jgi:acetate kinase